MAEFKWPVPPTGLVTNQEFKWPPSGTGPTPPPVWNPVDNLTLFGYWRADNTTGSGASLVATDLSPNSRNASVPGGVNAPTVVTNVINGHSVLRFVAASTQYMSFGTDTIAGASTAHIVWIVFKGTALSSGNFAIPLTYATAAAKSQSIVLANSGGYTPICWGGGDGTALNSVGISGYDYSSAFQYLVLEFDGSGTFSTTSAWTTTKNASPQTLSLTGPVNSARKWNLIGAYDPGFGGALPMGGDIAEIGIAAAPGASDYNSLQAFLADRYAL